MKKIVISGKGGAGKTTITTALVNEFVRLYPKKRILIIDADASSTLSMALGIDEQVKNLKPVGELKYAEEKIKSKKANENLLEEFQKKCLIKAKIDKTSVDFAYMGHHMSNSCLCGYNNSLAKVLELLQEKKLYDFVFIDREAGLEHVTRNVYQSDEDFLLLVSWLSPDYLRVVKEIVDTADVLGSTQNRILIINNILDNHTSEKETSNYISKYEIGVDSFVVFPRLKSMFLEKGSALDVCDNSEVRKAVEKVLALINVEE